LKPPRPGDGTWRPACRYDGLRRQMATRQGETARAREAERRLLGGSSSGGIVPRAGAMLALHYKGGGISIGDIVKVEMQNGGKTLVARVTRIDKLNDEVFAEVI
jgi:hypothetical protein